MRSSVIDLAAGVFTLLFAAAFYVQSSELEGIGRGYPMALMIFIFLGGFYLLARSFYKRRLASDPILVDAEAVSYKRVGIIIAASVAYVFLISLFGFYTASMVFLFCSAMLLNDAGWGWMQSAMAACVLTAIMCSAVWACFAKLLQVSTPEGLFF